MKQILSEAVKRERNRLAQARWRLKNPEKEKANQKRRYEKDSQCAKDYSKEYRKLHPEKTKEYAKNRYIKKKLAKELSKNVN